MKDVDKLFERSGGPRPRRRLRADFTNQVLNRVEARPKRRVQRMMETFTMKLMTKPMMAVTALVVAVVLGGTAYAAVGGWPGVVALFGGERMLSNGDRIVKVDTDNCTYVSAFNVTQQNKTRHEVFYKVKAGSKLTNGQVVQMVQGNCHAAEQVDFDQKVVTDALAANPLNKDRVVGGYLDSEVVKVEGRKLTLRSQIPEDSQVRTLVQTFTLADDVLVYASPNKLALDDIRVGDHVSIKYRASGAALTQSETIAPDKINTDEQVVVAVIKNTADMTAAVNYAKYNGSEFQEVTPCDADASGYCSFEQTQ